MPSALIRAATVRERLAARGERENSGLKTPFLTVKTTGETPVPQFCHGLLAFDLVGGWKPGHPRPP